MRTLYQHPGKTPPSCWRGWFRRNEWALYVIGLSALILLAKVWK